MKNKNIIGEKIKKLRLEKNITQKDLAKHSNCTHIQVSNYENGKVIPSTDVLISISECLGVTLDFLVRDKVSDIAKTKLNDVELLKQFEKIIKLEESTKNLIKEVIEAIIVKSQLKQIV